MGRWAWTGRAAHGAAGVATLGMLGVVTAALASEGAAGWPRPARAQPGAPWWVDASASHLPAGAVVGRSSMASQPADLDGDGDLDIVLAIEFGTNAVLRNEGGGRLVDATPPDLLRAAHDSEDVAVADFDGDGDLDLVFVAEDDRTDEYYLGDGHGGFTSAPWPLPTIGVSNAVLALDLEGDGDLDLVVGNAGPNEVLVNDGTGRMALMTEAHLPGAAPGRVTQDIAAGDLDGDGDVDLIEGNEDGNRILHNDGTGRFGVPNDPVLRYPPRTAPEETRVVSLGDVDGDGDLDLLVANVAWSGIPSGNRLLLNDGAGRFADAPAGALPIEQLNCLDLELADLDVDGDLDIAVAHAFAGANAWRVLLGDGTGGFVDATMARLPRPLAGNGIDADAADLDGDGRLDLYLANHGGRDLLLLSGLPAPTATATRTARVTPTATARAVPTADASPTAGAMAPRAWLPVGWPGRASP